MGEFVKVRMGCPGGLLLEFVVKGRNGGKGQVVARLHHLHADRRCLCLFVVDG